MRLKIFQQLLIRSNQKRFNSKKFGKKETFQKFNGDKNLKQFETNLTSNCKV